MSDVAVCIPSIPPRQAMLARAVHSVEVQTYPSDIYISIDHDKLGAPANRDKAIAQVPAETEWLTFLDDDDWMYPNAVQRMREEADITGADCVYPWFDVVGGTDPFPQFFGRPWSNTDPHQFTITFLVKHSLLAEIGGFSPGWDASMAEDPGTDEYGNRAGEDWRFILAMVARDAKIVHLPERLFAWSHHQSNTSGLPSRW